MLTTFKRYLFGCWMHYSKSREDVAKTGTKQSVSAGDLQMYSIKAKLSQDLSAVKQAN